MANKATVLHCNVCASDLGPPIYRSGTERSLTSLGTLRDGPTEVHFCDQCGHAQTPDLVDARAFYAAEYDILLASEEEDQLYQVANGCAVLRVEHQLRTLLDRGVVAPNARVLDLGCAKGAMAKALGQARPDSEIRLFDVSERYVPFWRRFTRPESWAIDAIPADWWGGFDLVMSFFVVEHVPDLAKLFARALDLLRPGGSFYFLVPNVYANVADLVVVDHANHFSRASLVKGLTRAGFGSIEIDEEGHESAFIVQARRPGEPNGARESHRGPTTESVSSLRAALEEMSGNWAGLGERVRRFEAEHAGQECVAVYGSGFYGAYLTTLFERPERVAVYLDQNEYRHRAKLFGQPIVAPGRLPEDIHTVYVALNPRLAHAAIGELTETVWAGRSLEFFYL